jgi:hypothetical protein
MHVELMQWCVCREVDHGYEDLQAQEAKRERHGWFYYRFNGGESPADCYDR